jgi:hypothetical protein
LLPPDSEYPVKRDMKQLEIDRPDTLPLARKLQLQTKSTHDFAIRSAVWLHISRLVQGCNYSSLAIGASGSTIYAAGSDGKLKALDDDGNVGLKVAAEVDANCTITQIALPPGPPFCFILVRDPAVGRWVPFCGYVLQLYTVSYSVLSAQKQGSFMGIGHQEAIIRV